MVKNPKFLKNLLTTASAVALIGGFSTSAMAVPGKARSAAANADFATPANWNETGVLPVAAGAVTNGDHLTFTNGVGGSNRRAIARVFPRIINLKLTL